MIDQSIYGKLLKTIFNTSRANGVRRYWKELESVDISKFGKVYEGDRSLTVLMGKNRMRIYDISTQTLEGYTGLKITWGELARHIMDRSGAPFSAEEMFPQLSYPGLLQAIQIPVYLDRTRIQLRHLGRSNAGAYSCVDINKAFSQVLQRLPGPCYNYDPIRGIAEPDSRWRWPDDSFLDDKYIGRAIYGCMRSEQESKWYEYGKLKYEAGVHNRYLCPQTCLYISDLMQAIAHKALQFGAYRWHTDGGYFPQDYVKGFTDWLENYLGLSWHIEREGYIWANREGEIFDDPELESVRYNRKLYEPERPLKRLDREWLLGSFAVL